MGNPVEEKSFSFALEIVKMYKILSAEKKKRFYPNKFSDPGHPSEPIFLKHRRLKARQILHPG